MLPPAAGDQTLRLVRDQVGVGRDGASASSPFHLVNDDLRPTTPAERTISAWDMGTFWVGVVVGVPSYYLAGTLVDLGMSWWQGLTVIVSANTIILGPLILTGYPGTQYGIPFPVLARAAFGVRGAHLPALLRSLVACGWFGIETWIGGQAVLLLLPSKLRKPPSHAVPSWLGTSPLEFACFAAFWAAQLGVMWKGMLGIHRLQRYSAPMLVVLVSWLFGWAYVRAGGFGRMLSLPPRVTPSQFWQLFFPCLTANVGSWATLAINIPDFTRHCRSQIDQALGQAVLPLLMGAYTFVGLAITSATEVIFGRTIPNPIELLAHVNGGSLLMTLVSILGISLAIITTNIPANVVAPANTLVSLSPCTFNFKRAAVVTALIGLVCQPWRIFGSSGDYVQTWLVGYSAILGPISGIVLADYYLLRRRVLDVTALYSIDSPAGPYYYCGGYNPVAMAALAISIAPIIPGFLREVGILKAVPGAFVFVYSVAWFFGCFSAALVYWILSRLQRSKHARICTQPSLEAHLLFCPSSDADIRPPFVT